MAKWTSEPPSKYSASVSFGKDSLAMLIMIVEKGLPLDLVVFYDTGVEFDSIYRIRDKALGMIEVYGVEYIELKPKRPFLHSMLEKPVQKRDGTIVNGYSWCGGLCRWGTKEKTSAIDRQCKGHMQYIGIAYDELHRAKLDKNKLYPLIDWKLTEKDCLQICRKSGFSWTENGIDLYDVLDRVSCWCCSNKNLKELENYYRFLPEYWERLKELQSQTSRPMKKYGSVFDLEKRFVKNSVQLF